MRSWGRGFSPPRAWSAEPQRLRNIRLKVKVLDADGSVVEEAILEATGGHIG
jgi:hypothetical protein